MPNTEASFAELKARLAKTIDYCKTFKPAQIDGTEDNAGCLLRPDSLARARRLGIEPRARLADNDGYGFFAPLGDLVVTGPTRTNVNDFRAVLINPE